MRRPPHGLPVSTVITVALASAFWVGVAAADAPPASDKSSAAEPAQAANAPKKRMHTIPEDGLDNNDFMRPNKAVRELMDAHPKEDLTICVAGCFSNRDRVVYAQPAEERPADPVTEPVATNDAPSETPAQGAASAATSEPPTSAADSQTDVTQPATAAKTESGGLPQLVPSAAGPEVPQNGPEGASEPLPSEAPADGSSEAAPAPSGEDLGPLPEQAPHASSPDSAVN